jgi:hypothetical protein
MALKYRIPFSDLRGVEHTVLIYDKKYSDSTVTELTASSPPVTISYKGNRDKFDPLIGSECELNILVTDNLDPFFGREFVTIEEDQYTVEVKLKKTEIFWTGFILPDRYQEQYLFRPYEIKLRASDGIARLHDKPYGDGGSNQTSGFGDVRVDDTFFNLYDILENTMAFYTPVNNDFPKLIEILDFYEKNQLSGYSTLQQTLIDSNSLFKDGEEDNPEELEPKDAKEVVEGILKAMGCRMYQHPLRNLGITDARWIVERVNAIYHDRAAFKFVDHLNSTVGTYPRTEVFNEVFKTGGGTSNQPTSERDQTYDPAFDLNKLSTFTEESNAGRNPDDAIIFTNESEPTAEFLPARPDAKVSYTKEYKKEGFQKNGFGKAMEGYIADPFFSRVTFDTVTGNYDFGKAWRPTTTPVSGVNISPGSNDSSGIALKTGVPSIYSTSPRKGNTTADGTNILVDGSAIRLKTKAKLQLSNGATANQPATRLLPDTSFPQIYVRVDAGGNTYFAETNSNNNLVFNQTSAKGFRLFNVKFDEANEFEFEFNLPNVGQRGTISIELFPSGSTNQYWGNQDTQVVYNYMQIVDVKDQNTNIRTYDSLSSVDTSVGRYEKELMFGDAGFPVTNGLKYINSTSVTNRDRFKALTTTRTWKAEATSNDEQPLLKSLTRQYMRNLREPSFILSAELWWGNLDADPFHLFLEENLGTNAQRTFTLVGQSIEMDIANRRLDGQWIQQLEEQESPGFIAPGPGLGIPTPGEGDGPVPQPGPIDGQLPNPDGNDFTDEVSTDVFTMGTFNYRVLLDLCAATSGEGDQALILIFLPDVNNIQCNQKYQVTAICNGCSSRNAVIQTNPNDSADIAGNNENEVVIPCGTSAVFIKSCSTGDWIRVA